MLLLDSIPLFTGIYLCLIIGLIIIFYQNPLKNDKLIAKIIVILILLTLILTPIIYFLIIGYNLTFTFSKSNTKEWIVIAKYIISIVLVIIFHYKVIIKLYKEGKF